MRTPTIIIQLPPTASSISCVSALQISCLFTEHYILPLLSNNAQFPHDPVFPVGLDYVPCPGPTVREHLYVHAHVSACECMCACVCECLHVCVELCMYMRMRTHLAGICSLLPLVFLNSKIMCMHVADSTC